MVSARLVSQRGKLLLNGHNRFKSTASSPSSTKEKKRLKERRFFESVLSTSTTKREAKSFLSRFDQSTTRVTQDIKLAEQTKLSERKVNLGALYRPYKALENAPVFTQYPQTDTNISSEAKSHVSIIKIQDLESIDEVVLDGVSTTIHQLARLGVMSIVVIDSGGSPKEISSKCEGIADAIASNHPPGARVIDQPFSLSTDGSLTLEMPQLILSPLQKSIIPVIAPLAFTKESHIDVINANKIVVALTTTFAHSQREQGQNILLDRIIFLENAGGMPDPKNSAHVQSFINLESEYAELHSWLLSNVLTESSKQVVTIDQLKTLECLHQCLAILPPTASALVTTAREVAESNQQTSASTTGVGTRPRRNPIIHNILTDKPLVSSSLPSGRLRKSEAVSKQSQLTSTVFKRGMPVHIVPDPHFNPWSCPNELSQALRLNKSPLINFNKLQFLIEDSFNRPLNAENYMSRVHEHLAGIIVAGEYEGGAILTWETPPNRPHRPPVPYLDKFAVLKRCQGAGGVADVVFNAMVRNCFPEGVVWRSRNNNPVNKWYFERASGAWHIPDTQWTMFWTGDGKDCEAVRNDDFKERLEDYVDVCTHIQPSWADSKPPD